MEKGCNINSDRILYIGDLKFMNDILESDLSDEMKAQQLYNYCNFSKVLDNMEIYKDSGLEESDLLKKIKRMYTKYENMGLFPLSKNSYRCDTIEFEKRLKNMEEIIRIINSSDSSYNKALQLYLLYPKARDFKRAFSLMNNFGHKDSRLDPIREGLNNFELYNSIYSQYELDGTFDNIRHYLKTKEYLNNYEYANFIINEYVNYEGFNFDEFLESHGIDKELFDFYSKTIEELDKDLFDKLIEKEKYNKEMDILDKKETITMLANAMRTGSFVDGRSFDLLEFLKDAPFKDNPSFVSKISEFMKVNNPDDHDIVMNFLHRNDFYFRDCLKPISLKQIYDVKTSVNSVELSDYDKDIIVKYLNLSNIPLIIKTFNIARVKYIKGDINEDVVLRLSDENKEKQKQKVIIIPNKSK